MLASALKWLLVAVGGLAALVVAALAAVPWLVDTPRFRSSIAQAAANALGRPVRLASVSVSAFPLPAVRIRGLSVAEDLRFGSGALLAVDDARAAIRLGPLLLGRVELADVSLDGLRLSLVEDGGRWNLGTLGLSGAARPAMRGAAPPGSSVPSGAGAVFGRVRVAGGTVQYRRLGVEGAAVRLEGVRLDLRPGPRPDMLSVNGEAEGWPGPVRLRVVDGALTLSASRLPSDATVQASIQVEAPDLRPLGAALLGPAELAGALEGSIRLRGTLGRLAGEGELRATRVVLAQARPGCGPPARRELALDQLRLPVAFAPAGLDVSRAEARAAGGTVSLQLGLKLSPAPRATLRGIAISSVQLKPILADYACQPYAISGALDLTGEAALAPGDPWRTLSGHGRLRVGSGQLLGAGLLDLLRRAEGLERRARARPLAAGSAAASLPVHFDSIAGTYRVAAGVVWSHDLEYESGGVRATAAGTYRIDDGWIDAAVTLTQGPATRVRARVTGTPGAVAIAPIGVMRGEASLPAAPRHRAAR